MLPVKYEKIFSILTNILLASLWALFAYKNLSAYLISGNVSTLLITASETVLVFIFIFRKKPRATSTRVSDWVIAFTASALPTLFRPTYNSQMWLADYLAIIGGCFVILSYLSLNRNFGIVPALRDIESRGAYAVVRHPIYASYTLISTGYCISNLSSINILIFMGTVIAMFIRISREEEFLMQDPAYKTYCEHVRWRLIPFVY